MVSSKRDISLDYLKGISCIFMIFAHTPFVTESVILKLAIFIGNFAPVLFFGVSGVTASLQGKKYSLSSIFFSYGCLFILGISDGYQMLYNSQMGLLQLIAIGCLITAIIETSNFNKPRDYLILSLIIFGVNELYTASTYFHNLPFTGFLFPTGNPNFPIFPWLSFFLLGVFVYRVSKLLNIISFFILMLAITILYYMGILGNMTHKWSMPTGYFLICCCILLLSFFTVRILNKFYHTAKSDDWFLFLGRNSLLFFYVHFFYIRIFSNFFLENIPGLWLTVSVTTLISMKIILFFAEKLPIKNYFSQFWLWIIIMIFIVFIPVYLKNSFLVYYSELLLGVIFSVYYPLLNKILKREQLSNQ